ncbi:hypothetical protein LUZ62_088307 [Rhynchospora pubera]|uniref:KIB1-4 beta-propeller domain-containing protein n=1 Tax=Rhynchospora pubera TaxID=906938 RepID=A0AAV8CI02_9POAL|nr:hypothetical protein LUZ62_088307 [Rhynchospora pubera]
MESQRSRRDWADLPADLVTTIAKKASTANTEYIHLRIVCKAWRRALTPNPRHLPPQFPWLLLPRTSVDVCKLAFCDPFQSKTHYFLLPYISDKRICGSSHGWLVLEHFWRVSLFNPITQSTIDLPAKVDPSEQKGVYCVLKAILSCNPSEDDCFVVASFLSLSSSNWKLGFCRIGDTRWTCLLMKDKQRFLMGFTCHKNILYTLNSEMEVSVYNLRDLSVRTLPSKLYYNSLYDQVYLVEGDSKSGEPLVALSTKNHEATKILVHKWFDDRQQWQLVRNIGKLVLFLNQNHSINLQLEGGQGNELYCVVQCPTDIRYFSLVINRIHLDTGKDFLQNACLTEEFGSLCGDPMWLTPSLI